jgi:hypothetical protein
MRAEQENSLSARSRFRFIDFLPAGIEVTRCTQGWAVALRRAKLN